MGRTRTRHARLAGPPLNRSRYGRHVGYSVTVCDVDEVSCLKLLTQLLRRDECLVPTGQLTGEEPDVVEPPDQCAGPGVRHEHGSRTGAIASAEPPEHGRAALRASVPSERIPGHDGPVRTEDHQFQIVMGAPQLPKDRSPALACDDRL